MSTRVWPFATLSSHDLAQAEVAAACARLGIVPSWEHAPADGAMLRFSIRGRFGDMQVAVAAGPWCAQMLPGLPGLAWSELVDHATLACWLPERSLLTFEPQVLADAQVQLLDVVAAAALPAVRGPRPTLRTAQGSAWIEQLRPAPQLQAADPALDLTLAVDLEVARVVLPLQRLRALPPGAVVLLAQFLPIARAGAHRLYTFDFTLETVSVNTPFDFMEEDGPAAGFDPAPAATSATTAAPGLDVARLPVTVEVVLCQLQQRVGDLAALQPGTVFPLPANAWTRLQLRVNGQTVAHGELVQVGDQLGVQLHQAPVLS